MDCAMSFLEQYSSIDNFNQLWELMPPYPDFPRFNKPPSQVMQWSGNEMKALRQMIVPVSTMTLSNPAANHRIPSTEDLLCVNNSVHLNNITQYY